MHIFTVFDGSFVQKINPENHNENNRVYIYIIIN